MSVDVHLEGLPEVRRLLAQFQGRELQNKMRQAVRAGAKPFQGTLRSAAANDVEGNVPMSFTKVPAAKVSTRGGASGRDIEARVRPKSPLFNIFEPGASAHVISPNAHTTQRAGRRSGIYIDRRGLERGRRKPILRGPAGKSTWDPKGRKRPAAFFSTKPVRHPGFRARPIMPSAFRAGEAAAIDAVADAIFEIAGAAR